jgi:hypothetical protein
MEILSLSIPVETSDTTIQKIQKFVRSKGLTIGKPIKSDRPNNVGRTIKITDFSLTGRHNQEILEIGIEIGKLLNQH